VGGSPGPGEKARAALHMSEEAPSPPDVGTVDRSVGVAQPTQYQGNSNDVIALAAAVSGLTVCAYLASSGLACCLPLVLGVAGLALAQQAVDPARARTLSLVGVGSIGLMLLFVLCCIALYVALIVVSSYSSAGLVSPGSFTY
jgi:hypothetical protein